MGDSADYSEQPRPRAAADGAVSVHDLVIRDLEEMFSGALGLGAAVDAVYDRRMFGLKKYEVILHADNGRDYVKDVDDELCDLAVYLRALMERRGELQQIFGDDYRAVLRLLIRWRTAVPMLRALEA